MVAEWLSRLLALGGLGGIDAVEADFQLDPLRGDGLYGVAVRDPGDGGGNGTDGCGVAGCGTEDQQGREDEEPMVFKVFQRSLDHLRSLFR